MAYGAIGWGFESLQAYSSQFLLCVSEPHVDLLRLAGLAANSGGMADAVTWKERVGRFLEAQAKFQGSWRLCVDFY